MPAKKITRRKLPRADAKLKHLPEKDLETLWRFKCPEEGGKALTHDAICVELQSTWGISVAPSTLSSFYVWLDIKREMDAQERLADQLQMELARRPDVSDELIKKAGQKMFMARGILTKDVKTFADMVVLGQNDVRLSQNDQKIGLQKEVVEMDKRKLALLEKKAEFADLVKAAAENRTGGVTAAEMAEIERKLKLM